MSKTKRTGQAARICALEKDLRRLRAQLPKEIHHAVRHEIAVEMDLHEKRSRQTGLVPYPLEAPRSEGAGGSLVHWTAITRDEAEG